MGLLELLAIAAIAPARFDVLADTVGESCWGGDFTHDLCCLAKFGPRGNPACWDTLFTYERCCSQKGAKAEGAAELSDEAPLLLVPTPVAEEPVQPLGIFAPFIHGADCWSDGFDEDVCCGQSSGPLGNRLCWDKWRSFSRCCITKETTQSLLAPAEPATWVQADPGAPKPRRPPVGDECWTGGFTWGACCAQGMQSSCWTADYSYARCCRGHGTLLDQWRPVPRADPQVQCLLAALGDAPLQLSLHPERCGSKRRFFMVTQLGPARLSVDYVYLPFWQRPATLEEKALLYTEQLHATGPFTLDYLGGLCLPQSCDKETVAAWIAPRLSPWWHFPRSKPVGWNETHALLPPKLAHRQAYEEFSEAWISHRSDDEEVQPLDFEFAVYEYKWTWALSEQNKQVLSALVATVALAGAAFAAGVSPARIWAPQFHLTNLGKSRGPVIFDIVRLLLTFAVIWIHACDHGSWKPLQGDTGGWRSFFLKYFLSRLNAGFAVLTVYLHTLRRPIPRAPGPLSWLWRVISFTLRRWLMVGPMLGFWTYVYLRVFVSDMPLNGIPRSGGLYHWFGHCRATCARPLQLTISVFLIHDPVMGERSNCHNMDIFEGLFQTGVVVMALCSAAGPRLLPWVTALLWAPIVAFNQSMVTEDYFGPGHRCCALLPPAFVALSLGSLITKVPRSGFRGWAITLVAWLLILASATQDALMACPFQWLRELQPLADYFRGFPQQVALCHVGELPFVLGLVLLLRQANEDDPGSGGGWWFVRAFSRLTGGVNANNLFIFHFVGGYVHDNPWETTDFGVLALSLSAFLVSTMVALGVFVLVEGPTSAFAESFGKPGNRQVQDRAGEVESLRNGHQSPPGGAAVSPAKDAASEASGARRRGK